MFLLPESQQRGRLGTRFGDTSTWSSKSSKQMSSYRFAGWMGRAGVFPWKPISFQGGSWKIHVFLLRGDIWAAWRLVLPPWRALLPAKQRRDRLAWTGSAGRTELKTLDLGVWFKVMFRHLSAFLAMTKFYGIFVQWVVKHVAPFTQQI